MAEEIPMRLFPIIDAPSARLAIRKLYLAENDAARHAHPEVEQKVLARAAEFGVYPPERHDA